MSTGKATGGGQQPGSGSGAVKVVTLGSDQYVIAKLDSAVPDGDYNLEIQLTDANPAGTGAAGCFAKVTSPCCKSLHIVG